MLPAKQYPVVEASETMPGVFLLWVDAPEAAPSAQPGQFFMVASGPDAFLRRPLSLHRLGRGARTGQIAFLFQVLGKGTTWLAQRRPGDSLDILGPLGHGFSLGPEGPVLAAAGGLGVAPLVALVEQARERGIEVTLLLGALTARLLYPARLVPPGVALVQTTDDGSAGIKGRVTDVLPRLLDGHRQVFACGPEAMYRSMRSLAGRYPSLDAAQVSTEARMGCGTGLCLGCSLPTRDGMKRVCHEGPVFRLGELVL